MFTERRRKRLISKISNNVINISIYLSTRTFFCSTFYRMTQRRQLFLFQKLHIWSRAPHSIFNSAKVKSTFHIASLKLPSLFSSVSSVSSALLFESSSVCYAFSIFYIGFPSGTVTVLEARVKYLASPRVPLLSHRRIYPLLPLHLHTDRFSLFSSILVTFHLCSSATASLSFSASTGLILVAWHFKSTIKLTTSRIFELIIVIL